MECGLATRLLELLRSSPLEHIKSCHTLCLFSLSFKGTGEYANALVAAGAVPIAFQLLNHSTPLCVTNAVAFLSNVLFHTWGTGDDGLPHPLFGTYLAAGADKAMLALFRKPTSDAYQKSTAAEALCLLYKNKALPADWGDVCQQMIALVDGDDAWAQGVSLDFLQCIVTDQGLLSLPIALHLPFIFPANHRFFSGDVFLAKLKAHCHGAKDTLITRSLVILLRLHEAGTPKIQATVREAVDVERLTELCCIRCVDLHEAATKLFLRVEGEGSYEGNEYMGLLRRGLHEAVRSEEGSLYESVGCLCVLSVVGCA
jgi:hypothetical protein